MSRFVLLTSSSLLFSLSPSPSITEAREIQKFEKELDKMNMTVGTTFPTKYI